MLKWGLSVYYSLCQGASTAASVGYSVYDKTQNVVVSSCAAVAALTADTIAPYYFQGRSIRQSNDKNLNIQDYEFIPDIEAPSIKKLCTSTASISAQLAYASLDMGKNFANRYFLLLVLFKLFQNNPATPSFWIVLIIDWLIKESFNLSNETYETQEEIAQRIEGQGAKPFYKNLFAPLTNSRALTLFKIVGSVEHVAMDDLAPWLALVPPEAMEYLKENPDISAAVISIATVVGIPLAALIFLQTYLFEGQHTENHLKEIQKEFEDTNSIHIPQKLLTVLKKTINIMGPIHGIATAAPVQITLRNLIAEPYIKWPVSILAGLFTFIGTAVGVHLSEVREAKVILSRNAS